MPYQAHDVEDVEQIVVTIKVAEVIRRHEGHERGVRATEGREKSRRRFSVPFRERGFEVVVEDGRRRLSCDLDAQPVVLTRLGRGATVLWIPVGPIDQVHPLTPPCQAPDVLPGDDDGLVDDAGVVEGRRLEGRAGIVGAALEVRPDLQCAIPELEAAVGAGWHERLGEPVVADDPRQERQAGHAEVHRHLHHRRACHTPGRHVAGGGDWRKQDQVGPKLRSEPCHQSGGRQRPPAAAADAAADEDQARQEDDGRHAVGGLRRHIHRVERQHAHQHRAQDGHTLAGQRMDQVIQQPRHERVQQRLRQEGNPGMAAEDRVEGGDEVRVPPRVIGGVEGQARGQSDRPVVVVVDALPAPRQRRPHEEKEESERQRDGGGGVDLAAGVEQARQRRTHQAPR